MKNNGLYLINASETIELRSRILRPNQDIKLCSYEEDSFSSTFHVGYFIDNKIMSSGTFIQQSNNNFPSTKLPYRLRGMATSADWQKRGLGKALILFALEELQQRDCDFLWFNARLSAEGFYKKLEFLADSNIFEIATIGPHKVMYKYLQPR